MKKKLINIMKFGGNVSNIIKREFNNEPVHNKKYLKAEKNQHKGSL